MVENPEGGQEAAAVEAVQMPRELPTLYQWVAPDVLGAPPILSQAYLDELKETGVIFGGGELERRYRVEAARRGERVCFMNLDHPTKPHWLWVNEVMFTEFGIRVPFTEFQQRLLNRACVAPTQLHPNAWASIRCFELVTEWLQLPQEPEVFMCLFTFYSANTQGTHRPFWLSLEGDGRFPSYWTDRTGFNVASKNLAPKVLLGRPEDARREVVSMAGNDVTLNRLRGLIRPPASTGAAVPTTPVAGYAGSGPSSTDRGSTMSVGPAPNVIIIPEEGSSNDGGRNAGVDRQVVSLVREQHLSSPSSSKRSMPVETSAIKRQRSETSAREFSPLDRSFDASRFIAENLLGPKAQEAPRDYDPVESFRWVRWALLKSATIMKSVEPRLTMMDEAERHNQRLVGDLKSLNLQKVVLEEQLKDAVAAKEKVEGDLKSAEKNLEVLKQKNEEEVATFQGRVKELEFERDDNTEDAMAVMAATEGVLKVQLAVLIPEFDVSQIGFFKEIVDGKVVDLPMDPPPS
ncbi:hypothetical protein PIB30_018448 [Stylosanthes scabra]|uniref:Uncharacterized protein n=1 Tax=Stylosanthes scabra TaxID=79078 RepID=A0ABU6U6Q8_9FABA|nr:hypothetical protein [Stylosanthes scabra]